MQLILYNHMLIWSFVEIILDCFNYFKTNVSHARVYYWTNSSYFTV